MRSASAPMPDATQEAANTIDELLYEFTEELRRHGRENYQILDRCPEPQRKKLRALMNVAALAYDALASEREARNKSVAAEVEEAEPASATMV